MRFAKAFHEASDKTSLDYRSNQTDHGKKIACAFLVELEAMNHEQRKYGCHDRESGNEEEIRGDDGGVWASLNVVQQAREKWFLFQKVAFFFGEGFGKNQQNQSGIHQRESSSYKHGGRVAEMGSHPTAEGRTKDEPKSKCGADETHCPGAFFRCGDVGHIRLGGSDAAARGPINDAA